MKTETRTAYVGIRRGLDYWDTDAKVIIDFNKPRSNEYRVEALIAEVKVEVPVVSDSDADKILSGTEIEVLMAMKEKIQAETQIKLNKLETRIGELQCLELSHEVSNNE